MRTTSKTSMTSRTVSCIRCRQLMWEQARRTGRKTMPDFFQGVRLGSRDRVIESCRHRHHRTRTEAVVCIHYIMYHPEVGTDGY